MKKTKLSHLARLTFGALFSMFLLNSCNDDDLVKPSQEAIPLDGTGYSQPLPAPCTRVCLVAGQHDNVGTVDVAVADNGNLLVTYRLTKASVYLSEIHLDVFSSLEQFKSDKKLSTGGGIPGRFAFKNSWSSKNKVSTYTVEIPKSYLDQKRSGKNCFFIASHAALTNGETAWGGICEASSKGVSLQNAKQFPGNNWSVFFDFCLDNCDTAIDFTYAWEDIKYGQNDGDYNDFVVQADVVKSSAALDLTFLATARGAHYEHQFKIRIPKKGIVGGMAGIVGAQGVKEEGDSYIITVFNGTKSVLLGDGEGFANTQSKSSCVPFAMAKIQLKTDGTFSYDPNKPYIPFISVYQDGNIDGNTDYDLSIYELTRNENDTWTLNGKRYPNGIIIPRDWKWPLEHTLITNAYPQFSSLTDGWNPNWANNLVNSSYTFDASRCSFKL